MKEANKDLVHDDDVTAAAVRQTDDHAPDLITKLDQISEQINVLTSMLAKDFGMTGSAKDLPRSAKMLPPPTNEPKYRQSDLIRLGMMRHSLPRSSPSESWISLSESWTSSHSEQFVSPSQSQQSLTEPFDSSPDLWMSPMVQHSTATPDNEGKELGRVDSFSKRGIRSRRRRSIIFSGSRRSPSETRISPSASFTWMKPGDVLRAKSHDGEERVSADQKSSRDDTYRAVPMRSVDSDDNIEANETSEREEPSFNFGK